MSKILNCISFYAGKLRCVYLTVTHVCQGFATLVQQAQVSVLHVVRVAGWIQLVRVAAGRAAHTLVLQTRVACRIRKTHTPLWDAPETASMK